MVTTKATVLEVPIEPTTRNRNQCLAFFQLCNLAMLKRVDEINRVPLYWLWRRHSFCHRVLGRRGKV